MAKRRYMAEEIVRVLRQVEVAVGSGSLQGWFAEFEALTSSLNLISSANYLESHPVGKRNPQQRRTLVCVCSALRQAAARHRC
jgi:hypothetical protein